ncbi:hypothetical protein [Vreelandella populi]|uniref:DUF4124 domain-containing protein n=1 Tax=Vreelandella populi TaxID=2498858 RepID=A0A433LHK4_9GAMM|nr:hypothetical protein [Halomonas populi]RUR37413.1 hypothetical protein ELY25_11520 [Halomonas populi]RUR50421.1 hypothetical protein ELY37_00040 [Halomonas populi]RUR56871.1 hypothetical protein ELY40_02745 [Halomonas populi]
MQIHRLRAGTIVFLALISLGSLAGCTTYTWPDGSKKTVLGVAPEDENKRYEEPQAEGVRYRTPGEIPEQQN